MIECVICLATHRPRSNHGLAIHREFQALLRAIWFAFAIGVAVLLLSGCTAQAVSKMEDQLARKKAESLKGWEHATLDGRPILKVLGLRTALVFRDFESVSAGYDASGLWARATGVENKGIATAAAISKDGYLLTARHVVAEVEKLDVLVVLPDENRRATQAKAVPARIVWMSEDGFDRDWNLDDPEFPLDLAIIHADVSPLIPFSFAKEMPDIDDPLISAGWPSGTVEVLSDWATLAAGRVLSVHEQEPRGSSPAWVAVLHDIPIVRGDSGGPVLDSKGNLVGINGLLRMSPSFWRGLAMRLGRAPEDFEDFDYAALAYMPNLDSIREVIENDRVQRKTDSANSSPRSFRSRPAALTRREQISSMQVWPGP